MAEEKEKNEKNENFEKLMLLIAVLSGMTFKTYEELVNSPEDFKKCLIRLHEDPKLLKLAETEDKVFKTETLEKKTVDSFKKDDETDGLYANYKKISTVGDGKVCDSCKPWQGKIISLDGSDSRFPSLDDYLKSGAFHPRCRCALLDVSTKEIPRKKPNPRANNEFPDKFLIFN